MKILNQTRNTDPGRNLAIEEVLVRHADEPLFMLWRDEPSIIVGRNQNTLREINREEVAARGIPVVRRLSGGGAVYHDLGNLCFTYIQPGGESDHARYAKPVVEALRRMGVPAEMQGRNDIAVEGRKISGNAQYAKQDIFCHHGTILYDLDTKTMQAVLSPDTAKIKGRGTASNAARVVNLKEYLPNIGADGLAEAIIDDIARHQVGVTPYQIPETFWEEAAALAEKRYHNWDWCFGGSPPYEYSKQDRFTGGVMELNLAVEKGVIRSAAIYGDFLSTGELAPLIDALTGVRHDAQSVRGAVAAVDWASCVGSVTVDEFLSLL